MQDRMDLRVYLSACLSICLRVYLSACLPACLPARLSVCAFICPLACLFICAFVCLSVVFFREESTRNYPGARDPDLKTADQNTPGVNPENLDLNFPNC